MPAALQIHWPEYLMEAALLGGFMVSACVFGTLLEHPDAPGRRAIRSPFLRRALMGLAMGLTAVGLIYSPWGQESGAHMNPATTLTFFALGKVEAFDAVGYIVAQFCGGAIGVWLCQIILRHHLAHASVNYVVTMPGKRGVAMAWGAEFAISFGMMFTVLLASNHAALAPYTGFLAGALLVAYIALEAPLSGMSLNPARTFGSALIARQWGGYWIYITAPVVGMLLAAATYKALPFGHQVYCAKLAHCNDQSCPFRCEFDALRIESKSAAVHSAALETDPP